MMRLLAVIGAAAIVFAIAAAGFFFGGFFNLSAQEQDPPLIAQQIVRVRVASIARSSRRPVWRGSRNASSHAQRPTSWVQS